MIEKGSNLEHFCTPESEKPDNFEKQFSEQEELEFYGGKIEVTDITPEEQKTEVPIMIAPGWGENPITFKGSLRTIYDSDRRAISVSHARNMGQAEEEKNMPLVEVRKAKALLTTIQEKEIDQIDVIAHSEGAINTIIAASIHPEKFRNIVLVGPGGLIGKDSFPKLFTRFSLNIIKGALRALIEPDTRDAIATSAKETGKYIRKNPLLALKEAIAISESDIRNLINELREQGIGVSIIHGVDDPVFPMDSMQDAVKGEEVDGFYSVKGGHNDIYANPDKYTKLAVQALDDLEKKKSL